MFSTSEVEYLKSLLNVYCNLGYKNYVAHTVTETDNEYDFCVYLSKDKITSSDSNTFNLSDNSIVVYVDSTSRNDNSYNPSTGSRDTVFHYHGDLDVNLAEFIYTNAEVSYTEIDYPVNPDILLSGVDSYKSLMLSASLLFVLVNVFLFMFIKSLLRLRR